MKLSILIVINLLLRWSVLAVEVIVVHVFLVFICLHGPCFGNCLPVPVSEARTGTDVM